MEVEKNDPQESSKSEEVFSNLPPEASSYVAALSSALLEGDVYQDIKTSPEAIQAIRNTLKTLGLEDAVISQLLRIFNL